MLFKLQLFTINLANSILLILFLCLGSQNIDKRYSLDFIINQTVPLPIGFLIGTSFTLGVVSGGITSIFMVKDNRNNAS